MAEGGRRPAAPDGGWGWMIVAGCFLTTICTRAVTRCVSIFFVEFHMHFSSDYSRTAWIHSLVDCTTMLCAPLGSYIGNHLSCRAAVMVGGLLSSVGLILSSFATSLEYLYLSLGVLTGVGFAFCYTPVVAMVGTYFKARKALAYGIAMSGTGIGTFILAPVVQLLIELYSWRGALLILGGLVSHLCVCGALMRPLVNPRLKQSSKREFEVEVELVTSKLHVELNLEKAGAPKENSGISEEKEGHFFPPSTDECRFLLMPDFLLLSVSFLFLAFGCSVPFVYLVPYSLSVGISHQQAALLMSVLGVMGIVGNITFGWISDRKCLRTYRIVSYLLAIVLEGLACLFVPLLRNFSLLVAFALFYGYFDGAYVALLPVVTSDTVGPTYLSSALGVVFFLHAIPYLISPPIAGWLVDQTGSYTAAFLLSGFSLICSASILATVSLARRCNRRPSQSYLG
ncbi:monocarboxylate transporter 12-B [Pygocentrus nattereri]|uniref:monocarboxylate transporter 12-B n=1 Tax=Pygocentrus nattereri TaxID=42514 RepID=UPI001890BB11|nr:monocarboxylate transporter 12-B [Pygocentrus nattereri]